MFFDTAALVFISTQMYNQEDEIEVHTREWKGGTSLFRDVPLPLESVFLGRSSVLNGVYNLYQLILNQFLFFQEILSIYIVHWYKQCSKTEIFLHKGQGRSTSDVSNS